ncbi:MAG: hypothetical protein HZB38_13880 [Planctomycetes bacterium]|nr:hypothetical protein [Planctomycetota bacterium]
MLDKATVAAQLSDIFTDRHARNLTANGDRTHYGFKVANVSDDLSTFDLVLTFKSGRRYCCLEWGCHVRIFEGEYWAAIRTELARRGLGANPKLTLRSLRCVVEDGALVERRGACYRSGAYEYEEGPFIEGEDAPDFVHVEGTDEET